MNPKAAVAKFGARGVYVSPINGRLRCSCKAHTSMDGWDVSRITLHLGTEGHKKWEIQKEKEGAKQSTLAKLRAEREAAEAERLALEGTRTSNLPPQDQEFCKDLVKVLLSNGIPLLKLEGTQLCLLVRGSQQGSE